ncbi:MAG: C25 family cysteine peptidase, partial [Bacteroidota bacterium]
MRRCVFTLFLASVLWIPLTAQIFEYGNDWYTSKIDQPFIKMTLSQNGIYRLSRQELVDAGYDLTGASASTLKVVYRGEEIPIFVHTLPSGDWVAFEFYGQRNDGYLDARMYRNPITRVWEADLQPDADVSLFSDQSAYFLTWDTSPGLRYQSFFSNNYGAFTPEASFKYRAKREYHPDSAQITYQTSGGSTNSSQYSLNTDYGPGEGYMFSGAFSPGTPRIISIATPFPGNSNDITVRVRTYGISSGVHDLRVELNNDATTPVIDTAEMNGVYVRTFSRTVQADLDNNNELKFIASFRDNNNANTNRICWADILYDRLPDLGGNTSILIYEWQQTGSAYLSLENVQGADSVFVFDVVNQTRSAGILSGTGENKQGQVIIAPGNGNRPLFVSSDQGILSPTVEPHALRDLKNFSGAEFVIIANRNHRPSAEAYAAYRDTVKVNTLSSAIVYTDELFDQFGYGSLTPWALKRFCKYALDNWELRPKYFLLWGKGYSNPRGNQPALVPTYGTPASDHEFISHFDPNSRDLNPEAGIGRVNIFNDAEGIQYLEKVKEYERTPWETWMKEAVFLGGGANEAEQNFIGSTLELGVDNFENTFYGGKTTYFQKRSGAAVLDPSSAGFHDRISEGVLLVHFFGHSAVNIQDVDIRGAGEYSNFGRFPLVMAMGCYGGNFTGGRSFGENWVLQKDRGAIGYLANSNIGIISSLRSYSNFFYRTWLDEMPVGSALGDIIKTTIERYTASNQTVGSFNHARQMNLQGDPSIKLYYPRFPDLAVDRSSIYFSPDVFTAQDDSFQINVVIENLALVQEDTFSVGIEQTLPDGSSVSHGQIRMA